LKKKAEKKKGFYSRGGRDTGKGMALTLFENGDSLQAERWHPGRGEKGDTYFWGRKKK